MKLQFEYEIIKNPYEKFLLDKNEKWAKISLKILDSDKNVIKNILDFQWDVQVFVKWFIENKKSILDDKCPIQIKGGSIAYNLEKFYENLEDFEKLDNLIEQVFDYRVKHDLRFALRGTDIESMIIGLTGKNHYTISCYNETENWAFRIDLKCFYKYLEQLRFEG